MAELENENLGGIKGDFTAFKRSGELLNRIGDSVNGLSTKGPYSEVARLMGNNPPPGAIFQGQAVALSGDGQTLAVGSLGSGGGIYVFVNDNGVWAQEVPRLTSASVSGSLGYSVTLSFDGNLLVSGAPSDNGGVGAAVVFQRENGAWMEVAKLVGSGNVGLSLQGTSVAISQNGGTIAIGGPGDNNPKGALWVFVFDGTTWSQDGPKFFGSDGDQAHQGGSVSLSANGTILAEGGYTDYNLRGATWVFKRKGKGRWCQDGKKIFSNDGIGGSKQGYSVSLDALGKLLAVGAPGATSIGAIFIYERTKNRWKQFGNKIRGKKSLKEAAFGSSVSFSGKGNLLAVGAPSFDNFGTTLIFERRGCKYVPIQKVTGSNSATNQGQGTWVSLSSDGKTLAIGGPGTTPGSLQGITWIFSQH
ncbi:MAG: hypothetical protein Hyperionvirus10_5 [Hyperionvirus sp.]|uniref:Uncharacterized protein n=1 Tax=Hyperionvirus sp. TaxID=2487770 RepID=A0A3G5AE75_9VIRU|nr:MAG: hypothetical protein Hyperionvirus10_5 [Hyperionvirus sp.]